MNQFHVATLKLTGWYLGILMVVCLVFSVTLFQISSREFDRPLPPESQQRTYSPLSRTMLRTIREEQADASKQTILGNLVMLNLVTLALGAGLSYLFARRTLRPVEEAMEAQMRFTSDASHELRTPLAVMRTENEIALRGKDSSAKDLRAVITSNLEEVARLQQLTDRLLALSTEQHVESAPFTVNTVFEDILTRHDAAAKQKNITLQAKQTKLKGHGNVETICDIVSILVDNAIKYSPEKTKVTIAAEQQGNYVTISVADQGAGIAEADMDHIFDRFYRADQSRSKQHVEGHGLGLALAKRLADVSSASLTVANRTPHGAVFTLQIPQK